MHPVVGNCLSVLGWTRLHGRWLLSRHVTPALLEKIEQRIAQSETQHTGELVLAIESHLPESQSDSQARALEVFGRLRVWDTAGRNGVLLYLCLGEHVIELVADRGITVPRDEWAGLCASLQAALARGDFEGGLTRAIEGIETRLAYCCPLVEGQTRAEGGLDNAPVVL